MQSQFTKYAMAMSLALALPLRAGASGRQICDGVGMVICAPLSGAALLIPKSTESKIIDAINKPDLPLLKKLLARHRDSVKSFQLLDSAIFDYVHAFRFDSIPDEAESASRWEIIEYLLARDTPIDPKVLSGLLIHRLVPMEPAAQARALKVAKLMIAHGGSYANIDLDVYSASPQISVELVTLMLENGADANRMGRGGNPVALNFLLYNKLELGELLLQHGANPNLARGADEPSGLTYIAQQCVHRPGESEDPAVMARHKQICENGSVRQIELLAKYGADLNGLIDLNKSDDKKVNCTTPCRAAMDVGNRVLADRLIQLGAKPDLCASQGLL